MDHDVTRMPWTRRIFRPPLMTLLHEVTSHHDCDLARLAVQNIILDTAWALEMPLWVPGSRMEFWVLLSYLKETSLQFWNIRAKYFLFMWLSRKEVASQRRNWQK